MRARMALGALAIATAAHGQHHLPGEILIDPADTHDAIVRKAVVDDGLQIMEIDAFSGVLRVAVPVGSEPFWVSTFSKRHDVSYAELHATGIGGLMPNDTHYNSQWHHRNTGQTGGTPGADIQSEQAWDVWTGSSSIVVAVLDTGIDSDHPEFAGRIDPDGQDFVNEDGDPEADHPHGTWVSGCVAANANNNFAVVGVDWECSILPIKVLNANNGGATFDLAQGLNYCANQDDVQIICMSLINYPGSSTLLNALANASNAGKILVACAGNGGIGDADESFPGASPLTISIGATTHTDARASFSGTGTALDFVAPGQNIRTVSHDNPNNSFDIVSGCSFATPITSGIVSLMVGRALEDGIMLTQEEVYDLLVLGAEDEVGPGNEDTPGRDDFFGHGRLNASLCMSAVLGILDCNDNGIPDVDEIAADPSLDQDGNGILDACQTPLNDECVAGELIFKGLVEFDMQSANTELGPEPGCAELDRDVWFRLAVFCTGTVTIDSCGSDAPGELAAYAACPVGPGPLIDCTDDACTSPLTFAAEPGVYQIRVAGFEPGEHVVLSAACVTDCVGDTDGSGEVDTVDLLGLLGAWGTGDPVYDISPPPDGDGIVDVLDLLDMLAVWGPCR